MAVEGTDEAVAAQEEALVAWVQACSLGQNGTPCRCLEDLEDGIILSLACQQFLPMAQTAEMEMSSDSEAPLEALRLVLAAHFGRKRAADMELDLEWRQDTDETAARKRAFCLAQAVLLAAVEGAEAELAVEAIFKLAGRLQAVLQGVVEQFVEVDKDEDSAISSQASSRDHAEPAAADRWRGSTEGADMRDQLSQHSDASPLGEAAVSSLCREIADLRTTCHMQQKLLEQARAMEKTTCDELRSIRLLTQHAEEEAEESRGCLSQLGNVREREHRIRDLCEELAEVQEKAARAPADAVGARYRLVAEEEAHSKLMQRNLHLETQLEVLSQEESVTEKCEMEHVDRIQGEIDALVGPIQHAGDHEAEEQSQAEAIANMLRGAQEEAEASQKTAIRLMRELEDVRECEQNVSAFLEFREAELAQAHGGGDSLIDEDDDELSSIAILGPTGAAHAARKAEAQQLHNELADESRAHERLLHSEKRSLKKLENFEQLAQRLQAQDAESSSQLAAGSHSVQLTATPTSSRRRLVGATGALSLEVAEARAALAVQAAEVLRMQRDLASFSRRPRNADAKEFRVLQQELLDKEQELQSLRMSQRVSKTAMELECKLALEVMHELSLRYQQLRTHHDALAMDQQRRGLL